MTLPTRRSARINGRIWRLQFVKTLETDGSASYGECDEETHTIRVKIGDPQFLRDTLFHELVHAACPALDEDTVREVDKRLKPAILIANGDMFDAASLSRHPRIGWDTVPTARDELAACQLRMSEIERAGRGARRYWNLGNHDLRMDSRLSAMVPAAEGIPGFTLREHFPNWQFTMCVDLNSDCVVKHRFRGGIHATFNNTLWAGKSIVTGHLHSQRVTPISDYTGTRYGVDSGCVAETVGDQFLYAEQNATNWRSGFCVLTVADYRLRPPELVEVLSEGRVWFRGEVLEV